MLKENDGIRKRKRRHLSDKEDEKTGKAERNIEHDRAKDLMRRKETKTKKCLRVAKDKKKRS